MIVKHKAPAPVVRGSGAGIGTRGECTRNPQILKADADAADRAQLDELAVEMVTETVKVEARLISAGFHDPSRLLDAGDAVDLRASDFADPLLGCCFAALWVSVNFPGRADVVAGIEAAARAWSVTLPAYGIRSYLRWHVLGLELDAGNIERYAKIVKRAARRRQRYARLWRGLIHHVETERDRLAAACGDAAPQSKPQITMRRARRAG